VLWSKPNCLLGFTVRQAAAVLLQTAAEAAQSDALLASQDCSDNEDVDMDSEATIDDALTEQFTAWMDCLCQMDSLAEFNDLDITPENQVMYDTSSGTLVVSPNPSLGAATRVAITTCNLNGFKDRDDTPAVALAQDLHQCVFFQETKINNADHFRAIRRHITNNVGYKQYKLFITDERTTLHTSIANRRKGVATFFHRSMPGFDKLTVLWAKRDDKRADFFSSLPRDFEDGSIHIVGGDFNIPMHASLDAIHHIPSNNLGKAECFEWLAALRVVDPWRLMYPKLKMMSGPGGRNRLDYIYVDHALVAHYYHSSTFTPNKYRGDHMCHTTVLATTRTASASKSKLVWRMPRELLLDQRTVKAIQVEAQRLLDEMDADPDCNKGAKWCGWLRRIKSRLRQGQFNRQRHRKDALQLLQHKWFKAKTDAHLGLTSATAVDTAKAQYDEALAEMTQHNMDEGYARHANLNEVATAHFLRKPPAMKIPIVQATHNGVTTSDPEGVAKAFTAHWKHIMTTPADAPPPPTSQLKMKLLDMSRLRYRRTSRTTWTLR
ncbi:hypothetical protein DYB32_009968, partial [Aphanomyces invadans]